MIEGIIRITPDKEKAKSIKKMSEITSEMIKTIDIERFPSNILKDYYDVIRELITAILLLDGYKFIGEEAHKKSIQYIEQNYNEFTKYEIVMLDDLRILRNKVAYDGFFIKKEYIQERIKEILNIINKLNKIIIAKLE